LAAAAMVTTRLRLGTLVASPNFRHPVPLAKELMTLDDLSAGRITLGIGSGGTGWDAAMLGQEPWSNRERTDRFAEFVQLTDLLLRQEATDFAGHYYSALGARGIPGCVQRPRLPFAVAATGPAGMTLAATYAQTWVSTGDPRGTAELAATEGAALIADQMARLEERCAVVGRDPSAIGRLILTGVGLDPGLTSPEHFADTVGRYEEVGVSDLVVHWPRASEPFCNDPKVFEQIFGT
jgi:alkanesulfonate monooxygenase SsuD/methylene tetrahydromethanopterin reductase-like flavin-dependent oxidoreductase (luciferase family)